jgi:glycosyltransferase involved in cell wall biosynthesis
MRVLLVDPSSHGGIALYTALVARALVAAGAEPTVLASRSLASGSEPYAVRRLLPRLAWGRPDDAGARFYVGRAAGWAASAAAVEALALILRPRVVHFQAPLNRRLDAKLVRAVRRVAPVVWTAHDVLPFDRTDADRARFAAIYRAADLVIVHSRAAADELHEVSGVEPFPVNHVAPRPVGGSDRLEARRRLGLPAEGRILAALGFVRRYKQYGLLAEVWEQLGTAAPLLLVQGEVMDESERPALERLERTGRAVVRPSYASETDLELAVVAADALLLPYETSSESGLLHQARALGVPVLSSDAPQLAASVRATSAGRVVAGGVDAWAAAVTEPLPPAPPAPATPEETGRAHLEAYELARRRRR